MFRWPRWCCRARVSWPSLASLKPQAWRSMCGWIGKGILAASPTRWMRRWKPMGPIAFGNEYGGVFGGVAAQLAQRSPLVTADRMHACNPVLDTVQVADLRCPQTVDKDHGRVAMPVAAMLACAVHEPLDLALGEIAPLDCQVYDAWCALFGCRFHADKPCLRVCYCIRYTLFLHSHKGRSGCMERIAIAMQEAPGRVRGMRRQHANLIFVLPSNVYVGPPVGGTFWFQI